MSDISKIKIRLEEERQKLKVQEQVIKVLEELLGEEPELDTSVILKEALAPTQKKVTLFDKVKDMIPLFLNNEFTINNLETLLRKKGVELNAKNPKARLSTILVSLCEEGFLNRTHQGKGNDPNKYQYVNGYSIDTEKVVKTK